MSIGRGQDEVVGRYGGRRFDETDEQFRARCAEIDKLEADLKGGLIKGDAIDTALSRLRTLKGMPPVEFDYDDPND